MFREENNAQATGIEALLVSGSAEETLGNVEEEVHSRTRELLESHRICRT